MLIQCWTNVEDGGTTLNQHRLNVSCLMRPYNTIFIGWFDAGTTSMALAQHLNHV